MRAEPAPSSRADAAPRTPGAISVVIPAYNAARHLPATLESVAAQTLAPHEVIVADDGSADDTREIAAAFGATVVALTNGGPSAARNVGVRIARGEYIAFLDADDLWAPDKLEVQFDALRRHGRPAFSFTDFRAFDERGFHARTTELRYHWAFRRRAGRRVGASEILIADDGRAPLMCDDNYIQPSTALIRRSDILAAGGFDETLRISEDYEFFLRLFRVVPGLAVMRPLMFYRRHPAQATAQATAMKTSLFDVARRVDAAPARYPRGDARFIARTEFRREFRLGMQLSRQGEFDAAIGSFGRSLQARPTIRARVALHASQVCNSSAGRLAFRVARTLWKRRPRRR